MCVNPKATNCLQHSFPQSLCPDDERARDGVHTRKSLGNVTGSSEPEALQSLWLSQAGESLPEEGEVGLGVGRLLVAKAEQRHKGGKRPVWLCHLGGEGEASKVARTSCGRWSRVMGLLKAGW